MLWPLRTHHDHGGALQDHSLDISKDTKASTRTCGCCTALAGSYLRLPVGCSWLPGCWLLLRHNIPLAWGPRGPRAQGPPVRAGPPPKMPPKGASFTSPEGGGRGDGRTDEGQRSALLPLLQYIHPPTRIGRRVWNRVHREPLEITCKLKELK